MSASPPAMPRTFSVIVAAASTSMGIGKQGKLPWRLSADMAHFKDVTSTTSSALKRNAVIMGRATWESIPPRFRPLPSRLNVVLSRQPPAALRAGTGPGIPDDVLVCASLSAALEQLASGAHADDIERVFVIGGA